MSTSGNRLIRSAKEALAIAVGDADPKTYRVHVPASLDVKAIRKGTGLTQAAFAARFGFTTTQVRDWEQGHRNPDAAARAFLLVIAREPAAVDRALEPERQPEPV
jgi:putative transcriptional regulator